MFDNKFLLEWITHKKILMDLWYNDIWLIQELFLELVIKQEELGHQEQKIGDSSPYFVIISFSYISMLFI
jgi:hypothetical protein